MLWRSTCGYFRLDEVRRIKGLHGNGNSDEKTVELDRRSLSLKLWTGRNAVKKLELKLSAPNVKFRYRDATLEEGAEADFEAGDGLGVTDLAEDTSLIFSIPYSEATAVQSMVSAQPLGASERNLTFPLSE